MDYENPDYNNNQYLPEPVSEPPVQDAPNGMSRAALVCGILSLLGLFFNAAIFFGAFAILFALLSRTKRMSRQAKAGVRMAAVSIGISALILITSLAVLISSGLVKKYAKRISEVNPNDPAAVSNLENDLINDLAKKFGIDPSSLQSDGDNENSPFDPTIENDNRSASDAQSGSDSVSENADSDRSAAGGASSDRSSVNKSGTSESSSASGNSGSSELPSADNPSERDII